MTKAKICREEAEKQIQMFKDANGFEDPRAIVSGGAESSLPEEVTMMLLSNIMMGHTEITDNGKKIVHSLRSPIGERNIVEIKPRRIKQHELRSAQAEATTEEEKITGLIQVYTGLTAYEFSELAGKDVDSLAAIVLYLNFI